MQTFKCMQEVEQARLPPQLSKAVRRCMQGLLDAYGPEYDPEDDGWVVLIDRTTSDRQARQLFGVPWADVMLEAVTYDQDTRCFVTCHLSNNQFGISIVVPDLPWLDPVFRAKLIHEMT